MTKETVSHSSEKFFFDQNIFDEDGNIESELIEDEEPPIPTFSEEQLETAKRKAFQQGHNKASEEEKNSREQHLAQVMEVLSTDIATLFAQEKAREELYEREAVNLVQSVFEKLFPFYAEEAGFSELTSALKEIIESRSSTQKILVQVAPEFTDGVTTFLNTLKEQNPAFLFEVCGEQSLQGTACRLSWENGGALHDTEAMAEEILGILKDGLAAKGANSHDKRDIQSSDAEDSNALPEEDTAQEDKPDQAELKEKPDE